MNEWKGRGAEREMSKSATKCGDGEEEFTAAETSSKYAWIKLTKKEREIEEKNTCSHIKFVNVNVC